ncbi:MAG: Asp-tRNA(Asn)/Glu-tRNA(Gln) amidotransferase subunit GatC [Candidatus Uhrbacteria bacterium]|nr:Asp-tRNA(Asn)/Glu-tRNA(Gln) amidotransferase subunit GatC [Candidatus Uhrbacteria bacterium]
MVLTQKEIEHIALLARLELTDEEKEKFASQLSSVLDYVGQLQQVDTTDVIYEYQVEGLENVMDPDDAHPCSDDTRQLILQNMPDRAADLLKVKGVFS